MAAKGSNSDPDSAEDLLAGLRAGDEAAFTALVRRHHRSMTRLAQTFVASEAVAEEVVQDTWMAVLRGLDKFEGRSSLKTWMFRILINRARSRGVSEHRSVPMSALAFGEGEAGSAVPADRFRGPDDPFAGYWLTPPFPWWSLPDERATQAETRAVIDQAIGDLPASQQQVVTLRDIGGWSAVEVCETLGLTEGNQRVLLHRGRARLRSALEAHFSQVAEA